MLDHSKFENFVIGIDYGCGIIRPHYKSTIKRDFAVDVDKLSSWEYYWDHHNQLLNLESIDKLYDLYSYKESFWKKWHNVIYIGGAIASIIGVILIF